MVALSIAKNLSDLNDLERRARSGDAKAFGALIRRFDTDLRGVAWIVVRSPEATDDVMQASYEKAFRSIASFDGRSALKTWLHSIVHRTAVTWPGRATMSDDELGRLLRDQVPPPGPGYWDAVDATLADIEKEAGDTSGGVMRPTSMDRDGKTGNWSRTVWLGAVAAAVIAIGGFAFALNARDDGTTNEAANSDPTVTTTDATGDLVPDLDESPRSGSDPQEPGTDSDNDTETDADTDNGTDTDTDTDAEPEVTPTSTPALVFLPEEAPMVWDFVGGAPVDSRIEPGPDSEVNGSWAGTETGIPGTGRRALVFQMLWVELAAAEERDAGWVPQESLEPAGAVPEPVIDVEEAKIWDFVGRGRVNSQADPGFGGEIIGSWAGTETGIAGTGRTAQVDGVGWIELAAGEERDVGWVLAESLTEALSDRSRVCYRTDGDALVLDFADDAETFTGALRVEQNGSIDYYGVAGRRSTGTLFDVAVQSLDGVDVDVQQWAANGRGMSAGDLTFVDAVGCAEMAADVSDLGAVVDLRPPVPDAG